MRMESSTFYWNYHGHRIQDLDHLHASLKQTTGRSFVWLAGDSGLDNKHWLFQGEKMDPKIMFKSDISAAAINGYEEVLEPPRMVKDVCYWLNAGLHAKLSAAGAPSVCAINTAIEESTLGERLEKGLLPQDEFLRDHLGEDDVIIVHVGGNDIALRPTVWTSINMAALIFLSCTPIIRWCSFAWAPCLGCYCGFPLGLGYFVNMFKNKFQVYLGMLTEKRKPKKVIACMLYYLDEKPTGSWADKVLHVLGYDTNPAKLKAVIKRVFELGVKNISLPGIEVVPFPLFVALDGTDTNDYLQRVEPSAQGGRKVAEAPEGSGRP